MFLIANCSLLVLQVPYIGYQFIQEFAQDPQKIWESRKNGIILNAIISLVPKGFHIIRGSRILWALFSVKSQNF